MYPVALRDEIRTWVLIQGKSQRAALPALPMEDRRLIEFAYCHGWTQSEIAEECNIPLGTVKARMHGDLLI